MKCDPDRKQAPRVLVVEDDPIAAMLIEDVLRDHFGVDGTRLARTVGAALEHDLNDVDLVLCDYNLPDGTGLEALRAFLERRPDLPVILVTSENEVSLALEVIRLGAYDYVVKSPPVLSTIPLVVEKNLEVYRVKRQNAQLQSQLERSLEQIRESNAKLEAMVKQLEEMAHTDPLTGLANRRHLNETVARMFAESQRYATPLSCVMIDLDGFKRVNDEHGHQVGDRLLKQTGRVIAANCRAADVGARYGGDEFAILMPQTDRSTAAHVALRLDAEFDLAMAPLRSQLGAVDMSIGVACTAVSRPASAEQLIAHADAALYAAKEAGKSRIMLCEPDGKTGAPFEGHGGRVG